MTKASLTLYRGGLNVSGLSKPIKIWWTGQQVRQWRENEYKYLADDYMRIKTTPYSMVEFLASDFQNIEFSDEKADTESSLVKESTLWYNYYFSNRIPIPNGTMNDLYPYPCVLLGFNRPIDHEISYFDYTGYFNYQFLKEDKKDIVQSFDHFEIFNSRFDIEDFTIAEYSVPPKL
jgi:hypothetical protein